MEPTKGAMIAREWAESLFPGVKLEWNYDSPYMASVQRSDIEIVQATLLLLGCEEVGYYIRVRGQLASVFSTKVTINHPTYRLNILPLVRHFGFTGV